MVPGDKPLIAIGYKYNARNVLYFIFKDSAGRTKTSITYLSKYPNQFTNVSIRPVACLFVMSILLLLTRLTPITNQDSMI